MIPVAVYRNSETLSARRIGYPCRGDCRRNPRNGELAL